MEFTKIDGADGTLEYGLPHDGGRRPLSARVYADVAFERCRIVEDCDAAGIHVLGHSDLDALADLAAGNVPSRLGDLLFVDCPYVDARTTAALSQCDVLAKRKGARLVVSTSLHCLDEVFGSLERCEAHIMVQPSRAERKNVLSRLRTRVATSCVRETAGTGVDGETIDRLSAQVARITQQLALDDRRHASARSAFSFGNEGGAETNVASVRERSGDPCPPDPVFVRHIIRDRSRRAEAFGNDLFADPAWDMLLDLTAAREEHRRVSVSSLCIASGVPATTALRWIQQLVDAGLFERVRDESDKRRAFVALTDKAATAMARYFQKLEMPVAV